ncbi:hypothetical protein CAI21_08820 [Alkalilimnicola ehrlichii]|uniref:OmpA-like domain-containing protein n=1 Tax=Alkalilimnicola ehrlichii TaxID=351052 RepID=A0A3E0WX60_9GAMM|nr:hypothetical protein CAI21_08820 [Alkalilimnicola ehrlichii]RFA36507.1 hypothetical protein CAL65_11095 [Alkalilimnicola ehrlichii]
MLISIISSSFQTCVFAQYRAQAVAAWLQGQGVRAGAIVVQAAGEKTPVTETDVGSRHA